MRLINVEKRTKKGAMPPGTPSISQNRKERP
jgi:hypothetical protein